MLERSASFLKSAKGSRLETAIWTAKLMMLSIGVFSTFLLFKVALIPCVFHSIVPRFLGCVRACLAPPYIYIIVNFIIISIAASSSAHKPTSEEGSFVNSRDVKKVSARSKCDDTDTDHVQNDVISFFSNSSHLRVVGDEIEDLDDQVVVKHLVTGSSDDSFEYAENSPPQAEDEEEDDGYDDSLDGTWKAIMEGKGTVKKPFLKKSDTWNATRAPPTFPLAERVNNNQNYQTSEMRKSETFNDRATTLKACGGFHCQTLLTSQDSLNARVEAFINKFQNDMRIEKQQSDMRCINMVKQQAAAS